jgi:hypothetical protein
MEIKLRRKATIDEQKQIEHLIDGWAPNTWIIFPTPTRVRVGLFRDEDCLYQATMKWLVEEGLTDMGFSVEGHS